MSESGMIKNNNNISNNNFITKSTTSSSKIRSNFSYAAAVRNNNSEMKEKLVQILNSKPRTIYANPDSAATGNYGNEWPGEELKHEPIVATCANESEMSSTKTKELPITELPTEVKKAHEFPTIKRNLLSVPLLCNADCVCAFCKDKVFVIENSAKLNVLKRNSQF